jgi:HK97 family phage major capsid protein
MSTDPFQFEHMGPGELRNELDRLGDRRRRLLGQAADIADKAKAEEREPSDGEQEKIEALSRGVDRLSEDIEAAEYKLTEFERREQYVLKLAQDPRNVERSDDQYDGMPQFSGRTYGGREEGLRAIERHQGVLSSEAADNLDHIVRNKDPLGVDAKYLSAVGDPAYLSAFGKIVADPMHGHLRHDPREVAAMQRVNQVENERALVTSTGSAGGFAIPFTLDPTILLSSSGVLNPVRQVAKTFTIATKEWKGISSDGVTVAYVPEATEATDASPTLAQPTITAQQWRAFIPFSIEVGQDWSGITGELGRLIADGRDVTDATQFLTGNGTNAPVGLLAIGTSGALTTTQRVQTDVAATLDVDDVWDLKGNLTNTRFAANARFAGNSAMFDRIYRMTPSGSTTEPQAMPTREGALCGYPKIESSTMVNTTTTGSKVLILGDFQNFYIADRLGMTVELIPHLFGATNRFPTGQRGLYAYGRTGTTTPVPNAFRYLEVL